MRIFQVLFALLLFTSLVGCSEQRIDSGDNSKVEEGEEDSLSKESVSSADHEGYIIDKTEDTLTIVWEIQQEEIALKTKEEILEIVRPNALTVTYSDANNFEVGDKVSIWTTGKYNQPYPGQGFATKVMLSEREDE